MVHDIDKEAVDGLSCEELSELLVAYAQENERLEAENKRLQQQVSILLRSSSSHLHYINGVRAAEAAIRRFCADPAIAPYIPDLDTVIAKLFGEPKPYGGDGDA
ncbi:MAG: hypothetical protein K2M42_09280 [Oscillospiraceae bacterium]|nr:hypothetical protein [Oscillospiraceae bacterium]